MSDAPLGRPWFAPKTYGYGATPSTWEGWLATAVFIVLVLITASYLAPDPRDFAHLTGLARLPGLRDLRPGPAVVAAAMAAEVVGFIVLVRLKSSAPWRWRWGADS